ncbi:hypothetical protein F66182_4410 [Fusarium sp. NRRL 66182]|nr:hypothetical protein F66182_4410 [Fusarium sp. NRRL 66182]
MSSSQDSIQKANPTAASPDSVLVVDFSWKKLKALVSEKDSQGNISTPKYMIDYSTFKSPSLVFRPYEDRSITIGTGTLHAVTIHADYELHGRKGTIKALKRLATSYTHLSYNYSNSPDGTPAAMTWTSASSFKTWDFICLDEQQNPVAKFSANAWSLHQVGNIEFLGPKANDAAAREEILVTGLTLCYQMVIRMSSILPLFGAMFARTGPLDKEAAQKDPRASVDAEQGHTEPDRRQV